MHRESPFSRGSHSACTLESQVEGRWEQGEGSLLNAGASPLNRLELKRGQQRLFLIPQVLLPKRADRNQAASEAK